MDSLFPHLTERQRRLAAAAYARALGYGGVSQVAQATGLSRTTNHQGLSELDTEELPPERSRRPGGGRKKIREQDPAVLKHLRALVDPSSRGDPMSPLAPPLSWAYRALGRLGGWSDTARTGRVGWLALWRGWFRLEDRLTGWRLHRQM